MLFYVELVYRFKLRELINGESVMTKRYRGSCAVCGKKLIVKTNGTVGSHQAELPGISTNFCYGGEKPPIEVSNDGLVKAAEEAHYTAERLTRKLSNPADHWRTETLVDMAKDRDAYTNLSASLKKSARSWKQGSLEEAEPAKKRNDYGEGNCCVCNRLFKIKRDGTVRSHNFHPETVVGYHHCTGENRRPLETTNEDCLSAIELLQGRVDWATKKLARPDFDEQERERGNEPNYARERFEIDQRVHRRYIENCQRNYDLWTAASPVPRDSLPPITDKPKLEPEQEMRNPYVVEVQKSGCLGTILLLAVLPIASFFVLR